MTRVVLVGRDAPLWLAAAALRRGLAPAEVSVTAVELPSALAPAAVHATLPALEALHAKIGIDEATLLRATTGAFSLGQNFPGGPHPAFFHGWGSYGAPIDGAAFFHVWAKARRHGLPAALQDFSPTAVAAKNGRLLLPDDATVSFGRTDYAYHLPAHAYAALLRSSALRLGVNARRSAAVRLERDGDLGTIRAVMLDDGNRVEGDLFVDASGVDAVLIGRATDVTRRRDGLPGDRRLTARAAAFPDPPPYADIRTGETGWAILHPTAADTRVSLVYAADLLGEEDAVRTATALARAALSNVSVDPVSANGRAAAWVGNCIAIGAAARVFDPVHDVDLHAAQLGIVHLLSLFPTRSDAAAERAEYNRIVASAFDRLHDFQAAFYALAPYAGAFWDRGRAMPLPDSLSHRIATFRARGEIAPMEDDTFLDDSWRALFIGLGVEPESWPPTIDRIDPEAIRGGLRNILGFIRDKVMEQPTHRAYLDSLRRENAA